MLSTEPMITHMPRRAETAAATRQALLDAAGDLLNAGGPETVTLREVGARASVSRSALYRHFTGKETLLLELVTIAWQSIGDALVELQQRHDLLPRQRVHHAFSLLVTLARSQPHLYQLMFGPPPAEPNNALLAAERSLDLYLEIVGDVVGTQRHEYAALLMASAHGAASLDLSGHLTEQKWHTDPKGVLTLLVELLPSAAH